VIEITKTHLYKTNTTTTAIGRFAIHIWQTLKICSLDEHDSRKDNSLPYYKVDKHCCCNVRLSMLTISSWILPVTACLGAKKAK